MRKCLFIIAAAALGAMASVPASADAQSRDRVHADSFGNLVIYSAAGYKRIIVGQGAAADGYNATGSYYEPESDPEIVYLDEQQQPARREVRCYRPPHIWHGRSYMYGLEDGVIPQAPLVCD